MAVHLSHRSEDLRVESAQMLIDIARASTIPVVIAGDFNSTPPDFPQSSQTDTGSNAMAEFDASGQFQRLPEANPAEAEFTFHAAKPRSVIDWILIPQNTDAIKPAWDFREYRAVDSQSSDHRPVAVSYTHLTLPTKA